MRCLTIEADYRWTVDSDGKLCSDCLVKGLSTLQQKYEDVTRHCQLNIEARRLVPQNNLNTVASTWHYSQCRKEMHAIGLTEAAQKKCLLRSNELTYFSPEAFIYLSTISSASSESFARTYKEHLLEHVLRQRQ